MAGNEHPIIETHDLSKLYGDGESIVALDGVNLSISAGEFLAVMGPSGSGKSTLLNMIGALDRPSSGRIFVAGEDLSRVGDVDEFRAHTVGFVFQLHNLLPALTALENVEIPMVGQGLGESQMHRRAEELLDVVGLADRKQHVPGQLSGGQRQRVAVARALANQPSIVLADEPTGSLDTQSGNEVMDLLQSINLTRGTTILVVTHDPKVGRRTQRILTMSDGKIVDDHRVENLVREDLRELARSRLGELLLDGDVDSALQELGAAAAADEGLTALRGLLGQVLKKETPHE